MNQIDKGRTIALMQQAAADLGSKDPQDDTHGITNLIKEAIDIVKGDSPPLTYAGILAMVKDRWAAERNPKASQDDRWDALETICNHTLYGALHEKDASTPFLIVLSDPDLADWTDEKGGLMDFMEVESKPSPRGLADIALFAIEERLVYDAKEYEHDLLEGVKQ